MDSGYKGYDDYDYYDYDYAQQPIQPINNYANNLPTPPSKNNVQINKTQSNLQSSYFNASSVLYSVLPSASSFIEPLNINKDMIEKDAEFIINVNSIQYKLPIYHILVNGHPCKVLIGSGACANYIHSNILPFVSKAMPTNNEQSTETANGQQTFIKSIDKFNQL